MRASELRALRAEADDRVGSRADILGSMLGVKLTAGQPTGRLGLTYLVRQKLPLDQLAPRRRVPRRLTLKGRVVVTDVVEWPRMVEQAAPLPTIISDGPGQGSLTCFGRSTAEWFGISCAHCLVGADGNPVTPTNVAYWAAAAAQWFDAGRSRYLAYAPGAGLQGNFGYLDCGLIELRDPALQSRAQQGTAVQTVSNLKALLGKTLLGQSALRPQGSNSSQRTALVVGVEQSGLDEASDLVLQVDAPGTFGGDSGMLWSLPDGKAAAVHARGERMPPVQGSRLTTAMAARRVATTLGVQLVVG